MVDGAYQPNTEARLNILRRLQIEWEFAARSILLFRCCDTYLDHSHNIIRFFDMPWILTTVAFNCLISVALKVFAVCVIRRTVSRFRSFVITFSYVVFCIKANEVNSFVYFQLAVVRGVPQTGVHNLFCT